MSNILIVQAVAKLNIPGLLNAQRNTGGKPYFVWLEAQTRPILKNPKRIETL